MPAGGFFSFVNVDLEFCFVHRKNYSDVPYVVVVRSLKLIQKGWEGVSLQLIQKGWEDESLQNITLLKLVEINVSKLTKHKRNCQQYNML